ncbi:MAG TPA: FkbM family methyltransferase [Thermoleophilaceae bacterium]
MLQRAKRVARRALLARGVEVSRRGGARRTMAAVLDNMKRLGLAPATVIDVGVGYGTPELWEAFPHARLLLVEPIPDRFGGPALEAVRRRAGAELVTAAAGAEAGSAAITVHRAPEMSSLLGAWIGDREGEARDVPVVRLDDVVSERGLPGPYVLKVDVEGAELSVLDGSAAVLEEAEVVLLEVRLFKLVPGAAQLHDVIPYMKERGFVAYDLFGGALRLGDGALAVSNIAFVREDGRFRRDHAFGTPEQVDRMARELGN